MTELTDYPIGTVPPPSFATDRSDVGDKATSSGIAAQTESGAAILSMFAIPLGFAGLGGVWQALSGTVAAPAWPAEVFFGISTAIWLALTVAYISGGIRRSGFTADRKHGVYGPFIAYVPVIGVLIAAHYVGYFPGIARGAVLVFVVVLAVLAAQLLAHWLLGNLPVAVVHPGYLLPAVAGAFIASIGLTLSGWHQAGEAAFGIGVFFWLTIGTLIFTRLFTGTPLPDALKPSLAVLVAPPATAGIAWLLLTGGRVDDVEYVLLGILFMMVFVQVLFVAEYRRLSFTTSFWAFTFPVVASSNLVIRWINAERFPFAPAWSWSLAGVATAFIVTLAGVTVTDYVRKSRRRKANDGAATEP